MQHTILCIDDEPDICDALERVFRRKFRVLKCTNAKDGLEILKKENVTVIICDQRMPNMTGVEFFKESIKTHPNTVRILLTGYADIDSVIAAINAGQIYRYVTKPWDNVDLTTAIDQAVERFELTTELKKKNEELSKALEELRTLDTAKNHFMILVNHELKTPLTTLTSYTSLLKDSELDADQKKYLNRIEQSSERLLLLVSEVLELVSAETNTSPLKKSAVDVKSVFDHAQSLLEGKLGSHQKIEWHCEKIKVKADAEKLRNIIYRLGLNAIKHGDQKKPVHITAENHEDNVEISVENHGDPLDDKTIRHILKPFTLNEDIMNHTTGLGLGLSICQAQLRQHGSELHFDSSKGKVRVSFRLPSA